MKKILITGGASLLGLNWILDRREINKVHFLINKRFISIKGATGHYADFKSLKVIEDLINKIKPDIIINTIGFTDLAACEKEPKEAMYVNSDLAGKFAKIAFEKKIDFIHISTDHLFDGEKSFYNEKDKVNPLNAYACSKADSENKIKRANPKALILRTNFFGWGTNFRSSISDKVFLALENNETYLGIENVFFTPISTKKLINLSHYLLDNNIDGIVNVCGSDRLSKFDFSIKIANCFNLNKKLIIQKKVLKLQKPILRPLDLSLSNKKLLKILNIKEISIESSLDDLKNELPKRSELFNIGKKISYGKHYIDNDDIAAVMKVLKSDFLTQGPVIETFEKRIANYVGAKYAVAVSSATAGLHLSYLALGLKRFKKILTSPITFVSTANAAYFCNAKVKFIDVDSSNLIMDPKKVEKELKLDSSIEIVVPILFGGASEGIDKIAKIAKTYGKFIVEDAAHGLGGSYISGEKIGSCAYSDCTVFSLHPVKSIAAGEGGVVTTNNQEIYKKLLRLRSHGINKLDDEFKNKELAYTDNNKNYWYYEMTSLGYHYRITDIQASLANSQLDKLDNFIKKRRAVSHKYVKSLVNIPFIEPAQKINIDNSANHIFPVLIDFKKLKLSRNDFMKALSERNILTQVHYMPVYSHPFYRNKLVCSELCHESEKYYNKALTLPLYFLLSDDEQEYVIHILQSLILQNLKKNLEVNV